MALQPSVRDWTPRSHWEGPMAMPPAFAMSPSHAAVVEASRRTVPLSLALSPMSDCAGAAAVGLRGMPPQTPWTGGGSPRHIALQRRRAAPISGTSPAHESSAWGAVGTEDPAAGAPEAVPAAEQGDVAAQQALADSRAPASASASGSASGAGSATDSESSSSSSSSWGATDSLGKDYLYRLGKEADNLRITVGAKEGMVDNVFIGGFLGKDADIVFKYRQKVTRSFEHLQGDYYIAPAFLDKVVTFIAKNYLADSLGVKVPLILGVWGGKGQGKTFQVELIFKALGLEPIILSAGELESEWAGQPGQLIRSRYRDAHLVINNRGKMSCLMINDIDAGIGRFAHTQCTVNNQIVVGTLMNLCDNPTRVSIGQDWREEDVVNRVPIIVTGNDFSTLWAPLIRDGRMEKFYWQPTREDIVNIVHKMYTKDGIPRADIEQLVDTFPNQSLDFFGALRARTYDEKILQWVESVGGCGKVGPLLVKRQRPDEAPLETPIVEAPLQTVEALVHAGRAMEKEQQLMNETRLSDEYMKKMTGPGVGLGMGG